VKASGLFTSRPKGVVVVQVLVNERGEVTAARLLQGLPGDGADARQAGEACVEAAKRIVFDPATSKDGKTRYQVWQGVGFYLD
jgi:TonB family protein